MEKKDYRKEKSSEVYHQRIAIIDYHLKGNNGKTIAKLLNTNVAMVSKCISLYKKGKYHALKLKKRGRKKGEKKKLTVLDLRLCIEKLVDILPEYYSEKRFWSIEDIQLLFMNELSISISTPSIRNYFKAYSIIDQKIIPFDRNKISKQWLDSDFTKLKRQAKEENAEIFWVHKYERISFAYDLTAKKKLQPMWRKKFFRMDIHGPHGGRFFIFTSNRFDGNQLIVFLDHLKRNSYKKMYLILNIKKMYPIKPLLEWLKNNSDKIKVVYVPQ